MAKKLLKDYIIPLMVDAQFALAPKEVAELRDNETEDERFDRVLPYLLEAEHALITCLHNAELLAWDGCHRIFIVTDKRRVNIVKRDMPIHFFGGTLLEKAKVLSKYWSNSCPLRYIAEVNPSLENPFEIPQYAAKVANLEPGIVRNHR